jgi:hypothetical protein
MPSSRINLDAYYCDAMPCTRRTVQQSSLHHGAYSRNMPDSLSTTTTDADGNILSYWQCLTMKEMEQEN